MFISEAEGSGSIYFLTLLLPSKNISENIKSERISDELFYHKWINENYEYFAVFNNTGMIQKINLINQEVSVPEGLSIILFANGKETERKSIGF